MGHIAGSIIKRQILEFIREVYEGYEKPQGTWVTDNEPNAGFLGSIANLNAEQASRLIGTDTIAGQTNHLRYALNLANRAMRGENAYAGANWKESWTIKTVGAAQWTALRQALRTEFQRILEVVESDFEVLEDPARSEQFASLLSLIGHGAWHLGAVRKMLEVRTHDRE